MTLDQAKEILDGIIEADGGLGDPLNYTAWNIGEDTIVLDGEFDIDALEAMVVYIRSTQKGNANVLETPSS